MARCPQKDHRPQLMNSTATTLTAIGLRNSVQTFLRKQKLTQITWNNAKIMTATNKKSINIFHCDLLCRSRQNERGEANRTRHVVLVKSSSQCPFAVSLLPKPPAGGPKLACVRVYGCYRRGGTEVMAKIWKREKFQGRGHERGNVFVFLVRGGVLNLSASAFQRSPPL